MNLFRKRWKWFFYGYVAFDLFFGGICGGFLPLSDLAGQARAQGPEPFPAQQLVTNKLWVVPAQPNPQQVPSASVSLSGNPGPATFFYWIVSNYQAGNSSPAGPFAITNAPNVLSVSNFDIVNFVSVSDSGVTYDILRTTTPVQPSGACNCAVATAQSGSPVNDQSNSLNPYTVVTLDPNTLNITLTNEVQGAGSAHLILRINGVLVSDLSTTGGTAINPTNNALPKRLNATTFGDSALTDNGSTVSSSEPGVFLGAQPQLTVGANGGIGGQICLKGSTSGCANITAPAVAGTPSNPILFNNQLSWPSGLGAIIQINGPSDQNLTINAAGGHAIAIDNATVTEYFLQASGISGNVANLNLTAFSYVPNFLMFSRTAPTISSGFGTSPSISNNNGSGAFRVNVGTGGTASAGVIGMPTATTGYECHVNNITAAAGNRADNTVQTASTTNTVTVQNQTKSTGAAVAWTASDIVSMECGGD